MFHNIIVILHCVCVESMGISTELHIIGNVNTYENDSQQLACFDVFLFIWYVPQYNCHYTALCM